MAINVRIAATDELTPSAIEAASALEKVAAREREVNALAEKLDVPYKDAAKAINLAEKEARDFERTEARAASEAGRLRNDTADIVGDIAGLPEPLKKSLRFMDGLGPSAVLVGFGVAAVAVGVAAAVVGTVALSAALTKAASEAGRARDEARALMGGLTRGRGDKALALVDGLAVQLGVSIGEAREQFIKFRKAGLDNRTSANLIKLRADLRATGLSAEAADEEIANVLRAKGERARAREIREIADAYGVVGDGALAAKAAQETARGAFARIGNVSTKQLEKFWDRIEPSINESSQALASFVEHLVETPEFESAMGAVGDAITGTFNTAKSFFSFFERNWDSFVAVAEIASAAFSAAILPLRLIFGVVGDSFSAMSSLFDLAGKDAISTVRDFVVSVSDALSSLPKTFKKIGLSIVDGLIDGIKSASGFAVDAAGDLAGDVADTFTKALGISSPSKLFATYGEDTVTGFEKGQRQEAQSLERPLAEAAARPIETPQTTTAEVAEPIAVPRNPAPDENPQSSGAGLSVENLNVTVEGTNSEEIAIEIRRELQKMVTAMQLSRGGSPA